MKFKDYFYQTLTERAFHSSPHNITDKFDLKYIGTGEGNRTFGWGLYFAENPKVTDEYDDQFKERGYDQTYIYDVEKDFDIG